MKPRDLSEEIKALFLKKEILAIPVSAPEAQPKTIEDLEAIAHLDWIIDYLLRTHKYRDVPLEPLLIEYALFASEELKHSREKLAFFHQTMSYEQKILYDKKFGKE